MESRTVPLSLSSAEFLNNLQLWLEKRNQIQENSIDQKWLQDRYFVSVMGYSPRIGGRAWRVRVEGP